MKSSRKLIGLVMSENAEGHFWNNANYTRWIMEKLGNVIPVDPYEMKLLDLDLLVLPGGSDINPLRYDTYWHPNTGLPNRSLEYFDQVILPRYVKNNTPIFGICRGLQSLNVLFGGTLFPHVENEPASYATGEPAHYVEYDGMQYLASSNHHQSIHTLGDGFQVIMKGYAIGKTLVDGSYKQFCDKSKPLSIEGIRHNKLPILATQFHPEKQFEAESCKSLNKVVENLIRGLMTR